MPGPFRHSTPWTAVLGILSLGLCGGPGAAAAEPFLRQPTAALIGLPAGAAPLVRLSAPVPQATRGAGAGSLFVGRDGASLFAPLPSMRENPSAAGYAAALGLRPSMAHAEHLRVLIGRAESSRMGYDAVQHAARIKPAKPPTQLTLGEIYQWIAETPGQQHAIGRYQFIPSTLKRVARQLGVPPETVFSPRVQDSFADVLLEEAGLSLAIAGVLGRHAFMNNLAAVWAGLPTSSGRSHYHGIAGNRATMSWADFDAEMARLFPS